MKFPKTAKFFQHWQPCIPDTSPSHLLPFTQDGNPACHSHSADTQPVSLNWKFLAVTSVIVELSHSGFVFVFWIYTLHIKVFSPSSRCQNHQIRHPFPRPRKGGSVLTAARGWVAKSLTHTLFVLNVVGMLVLWVLDVICVRVGQMNRWMLTLNIRRDWNQNVKRRGRKRKWIVS